MKKFTTILILMMMVCNIAFAESTTINEHFPINKTFPNENFSIRNGIAFKMKAKEVQQVEAANGNTTKGGWLDKLNFQESYAITLAGHGCEVMYYFGNQDVLSELEYLIVAKDTFEFVKTSLSEKYGEPNTGESAFESKIFDFKSGYKECISSMKTEGWWLIQYQDCYVAIEIGRVNLFLDIYLVNYKILSYNDYEKAVDAYLQEKQAVESGL